MTCPCGNELKAVATGVTAADGEHAYQIFEIRDGQYLHAYEDIGVHLRKKKREVLVVGRGKTSDVVQRFI